MRRNKDYDRIIDILIDADENVSVYINDINPKENYYQVVVYKYPHSISIYRMMNTITNQVWYVINQSRNFGKNDFEYIIPHLAWKPEHYFQQSTLHEIPYEQYELAAIVQFMESKVLHSQTHSTIGKPVFADFLLQSIKEFT